MGQKEKLPHMDLPNTIQSLEIFGLKEDGVFYGSFKVNWKV
jgi:hypothetical protein